MTISQRYTPFLNNTFKPCLCCNAEGEEALLFSFLHILVVSLPLGTWFNSDLSIGSCLASFRVSKDLSSKITSCEIIPCILSDHEAVILQIEDSSVSPDGPGIWKFNNSLLSDTCYCNLRGRLPKIHKVNLAQEIEFAQNPSTNFL